MKKTVVLVLAILLVVMLSPIALAETPEPVLEAEPAAAPVETTEQGPTVLAPVDMEDIYVYIDEDDPDQIALIDQLDEDDALAFIEYLLNPFAEEQGLDFDAVSQIGFIQVVNSDFSAYSGSGWVQVWNDEWCSTDIVTVVQFLVDLGIFSEDVLTATFDSTDGSWWFYVDDIGLASLFFALIERGVSYDVAKQIVADAVRSPQTADTSMHTGLILLTLFAASAVSVVAVKKARQ